MRAFLTKLGSQKEKEKDLRKEKIPQLGPLPDWPPAPSIITTPTSATTSSSSIPKLAELDAFTSTTAAAASAATTVGVNKKVAFILPTTTYATGRPLRSPTPPPNPRSSSSSLLATGPTSWSKFTESDLVANLNSRERTRQEVLYEIVSSEERYASELAKMKETFAVPLLHSFFSTSSSQPSTPHPGSPLGDFGDYDEHLRGRPSESSEHLPIASRFLYSPLAGSSTTPVLPPIGGGGILTPETSDDDSDYHLAKGLPSKQHTRSNRLPSVYLSSANQSDSAQSSTQGLTQGNKVLRWGLRSPTPEPVVPPGAVPPHQLPEDLRICLEVIENELLGGHLRLSEAFKRRYGEQYPLVRTIADVFVSSSHILTSYTKYVLHLERALEQVDNAVRYASSLGHKPPKKQEGDQFFKVGAYLQRLEMNAAQKGETGLAISLSKPFQRLLDYPVMFQNLLFHTDPSTFEYERTLQMVAEVERIVRSIEDEKIRKEELEKTRDVLGRIDGLEKIKQLMRPKPSRVLVEERVVAPVGASGSGIGGKKDLWLVVFNDVVLRCQRTGTTLLPIRGVSHGRTNSMPELQGKPKPTATGRKPRNLYKFIKIETWVISNHVQPREGVVSMDEIVRSRALHASAQPRIMPLPDNRDEEAGDSDDSDQSFLNWGPNRKALQKPVASNLRQVVPTQKGMRRGPTLGVEAPNRDSSANAKFGTRLLSAEPITSRPFTRHHDIDNPVRQYTPDNNVHKATVTRPTWGENQRPRSQDSGVGLYRQLLANNSSSWE